MAGTYTDLGGGRYAISHGGMSLPVSLSREQLEAQGFAPEPTTFGQPLPMTPAPAPPPPVATAPIPPPQMSFTPEAQRQVRAVLEPPAPPPSTYQQAGEQGAPVETPSSKLYKSMQAQGPSGEPPKVDVGSPIGAPEKPGTPEQRALGIMVRPAGRAVPEKWQPASMQTQMTQYDPAAMAEAERQSAIAAAERAKGYQSESAIHIQQATELEQEAREQDDIGKMRRAQINRRLAALELERAQIADSKVDPTKYITDSGARTLIMAAAAAAGEYGHILGRTAQNNALNIFQTAIDRDIDAQKFAIQQRQQGLQTKMTLLDRYMQDNDPATAEQMARATMREAGINQLEASKAFALARSVEAEDRAAMAKLKAEASKQTVAGAQKFIPAHTVGGSVVDLDALQKATGLPPDRLVIFAQTDPKQAKAVLAKYYETHAAAAGKGDIGGPRPFGSRTATKVASTVNALQDTDRLIKEFEKNPIKANLESRKEGTPLNSYFKRLVFNQTHVASAAPSKENIELLTHELQPPGITSTIYGAKATLDRLRYNKKQLEEDLRIYESTRGGPGQESEEGQGER